MRYARIYLKIFIAFAISSCQENADTLFEALDSRQTGISFNNQLTESDSFNIVDFDYIYNGAGVGIADLNGDGLPDIFFGGNQVTSRLYINQGNFKFSDITEAAGVSTLSWVEGVTFVDINQDGRLDIYLSVSNRQESRNPNLLFVNEGNDEQGNPRFKEQANAFGLDRVGYFTQAAFFDFDRDGDLDVYLLANALESFQRNISRPRITDGTGKSNDVLLRNEGDGSFVDVSLEAGIHWEGYGLGLLISDLDQDGWPDIYVANDFLTNDILYINQRDATFRNEIKTRVDHQSFNSMGADMGDINRDGWPDIVVADMFPPDNFRQKTMFSPTENFNLYQANLDKGYEPQYVRNVLQLNRGNGTFAEIGEMADVSQTDWSWSPLLEDFDLDGWQDLIISNGYGKDITDLDYINYANNLGPFMTPEEKKKLRLDGLNILKEVKLKNFAFRNTGNLSFEDVSASWGIDDLGIANGMAYADLDGDGDLDLVTNNLNQEAGIYRNNLISERNPVPKNWIKVRLKGSKENPFAFGASVSVYINQDGKSHLLRREVSPTRGYKSAMYGPILLGLGSVTAIDSLVVHWPDGSMSKQSSVKSNQIFDVSQNEGNPTEIPVIPDPSPLFKEVSLELGLHYQPSPQPFTDFNHQVLLHRKHSDLGPGLAVGDIDGDGLDDFYLTGSVGSPGQLFAQQADGRFKQKTLAGSGEKDEMGALLFDADGDGDVDLYIVSGGSRFPAGDDHYQDSFYLNDGKGNFTKDNGRIPSINSSGSTVIAADFDQDGDLDLFVGGRITPGRYPETPRSYLLENQGGNFVDATDKFAAELAEVGMVSSAIWTDYNQDGNVDLLIAGDWMPLTVFLAKKEGADTISLERKIIGSEDWDSRGWWNSITPLSFNAGQKPRFAVGNVGLNTRWKSDQTKPIALVFGDFDGNGSVDPILFQHYPDGRFTVQSRNQLTSQIPKWKTKFLVYREFATIDRRQFFSPEEAAMADSLLAPEFHSGVYEEGIGFVKFPREAQISRIFGAAETSSGLVYAGNYFGNETVTGRSDASRGGLISLGPKNELHLKVTKETGLDILGEARAVAVLTRADQVQLILVSRFNQPLLAFVPNGTLPGTSITPNSNERLAIFYQNGNPAKHQELTYGSGYLSQSSRKIWIPAEVDSVQLVSFAGSERTIKTVPEK